MTIKQWIEINGWAINPDEPVGKFWNVDIGFINSENRREDETEFTISAYDLPELEALFDGFCEENNIMNDAVVYVAVVETAENEEELS